jgi:2,5-diketo-D-gluconate reductase A
MTVPTIVLNDGTSIPQLGFGVFKVDPDETKRIVSDALEVGYRHLDTAMIYGNETGVGAAIADSGIERENLFVTTKLWNSDQGTQSALDAFDLSLAKLGLDYVDLYLIHWPSAHRGLYVESWKALEQIAESGRAKSIGVSNFTPKLLQPLLDAADVVPSVNQIEYHPYFQQLESKAFNTEHGIVTESWGPLGQGDLVDDAGVDAIAAKYGKSVAQVIIRWHLDIGNIVIPKSNRKERMAENFDVTDFSLTPEEVAVVSAVNRGEAGRKGSNPEGATF